MDNFCAREIIWFMLRLTCIFVYILLFALSNLLLRIISHSDRSPRNTLHDTDFTT
ncbi:hypothetical protein BKA69DRAFT_1049243, partial [Paraphysoderma sedebokerense]